MLYEGMFLLDNQVVRADWAGAKGAVAETLAKHGAKLVSARRWDERKLAFTIKGKARATYLLSYFELAGEGLNTLRRDFELDERVLRYLLLRVDEIPAGELEKAAEEVADGFEIPSPPVEEEQSDERRVFGDLADRPVQEHARRSRGRGGDSAQASDSAEGGDEAAKSDSDSDSDGESGSDGDTDGTTTEDS